MPSGLLSLNQCNSSIKKKKKGICFSSLLNSQLKFLKIPLKMESGFKPINKEKKNQNIQKGYQ